MKIWQITPQKVMSARWRAFAVHTAETNPGLLQTDFKIEDPLKANIKRSTKSIKTRSDQEQKIPGEKFS